MEAMIFIILGVMLINDSGFWTHWNTAFSLISLALVFVIRFASAFVRNISVAKCSFRQSHSASRSSSTGSRKDYVKYLYVNS